MYSRRYKAIDGMHKGNQSAIHEGAPVNDNIENICTMHRSRIGSSLDLIEKIAYAINWD